MDGGNDDKQVVRVGNKLIALIFSVLAFIWTGLFFVFAQLILFPDMSFSDNGLIRLIGLLICFAVASKFYDYFTDRNDGKSMAMVIIIVVFIITLVMGFLMVQ